jgi:hypothetical protein
MECIFNISFFSLITGVVGLVMDIIGVFKLFNVEAIQLKEIDKAPLRAIIGGVSKQEADSFIVNELNEQIKSINRENKNRESKAKRYRKYLIGGFLLQIISIVLSYLSTFIN